MTTLMWDGKTRTLLADTRTIYHTTRRKTLSDGGSKIMTLRADDYVPWDRPSDERIVAIAGAGNPATVQYLKKLVIYEGNKISSRNNDFEDIRHMLAPSGKATLIVVTETRCHRIDFPVPERGLTITTTPHTQDIYVGSGAEALSVGVRVFGLSGEHAMILARCFDPATGGDIQAVTLSEDRPGLMRGRIPLISEADDFNTVRRVISRLPERESEPFDQGLYSANSELQAGAASHGGPHD